MTEATTQKNQNIDRAFTLAEFSQSRRDVADLSSITGNEDDENIHAYIYPANTYISKVKIGGQLKLLLTLGSNEYVEPRNLQALEKLEGILYKNHYLPEMVDQKDCYAAIMESPSVKAQLDAGEPFDQVVSKLAQSDEPVALIAKHYSEQWSGAYSASAPRP